MRGSLVLDPEVVLALRPIAQLLDEPGSSGLRLLTRQQAGLLIALVGGQDAPRGVGQLSDRLALALHERLLEGGQDEAPEGGQEEEHGGQRRARRCAARTSDAGSGAALPADRPVAAGVPAVAPGIAAGSPVSAWPAKSAARKRSQSSRGMSMPGRWPPTPLPPWKSVPALTSSSCRSRQLPEQPARSSSRTARRRPRGRPARWP